MASLPLLHIFLLQWQPSKGKYAFNDAHLNRVLEGGRGGRGTLQPVLRTLFITSSLHSITYTLELEKTNQHSSPSASMFVNEQNGEGLIVLQNCKSEKLDKQEGCSRALPLSRAHMQLLFTKTIKGNEQRQFNRP